MVIPIILAHPDPQSFNHAMAATVLAALRQNGHHPIMHDLYAEGFDPVLMRDEIPKHAAFPGDIAGYCGELSQADGIVVIHPNWWGQPPAILKGFVDRVFRPGTAYAFLEGDSGEGIPVGLLRARTALVLNTSNTPEPREREAFGDPLDALWKRCIFPLCGVEQVERRMFSVMVTSTPEERRAWLDQVNGLTRLIFPANDEGMETP